MCGHLASKSTVRDTSTLSTAPVGRFKKHFEILYLLGLNILLIP